MFKNLLRTAVALGLAGTLFFYCLVPASAYTVQSGDTLSKIAAQNGITVAELMELNGITNASEIYSGESLKVSKTDTSVVSRQTNGTAGSSNAATSTAINAQTRALLKNMFDADYYAKQNPTLVALIGNDPNALFAHFVQYGIWEGRQVNPKFNVSAYASAYKDLDQFAKGKGMSAAEEILFLYQHYESFGKVEEREITTVEAALVKGISVTSVASAKTATGEPIGGTVIAAPAPDTSEGESESASPIDTASLAEALTLNIDGQYFELSLSSSKDWSEYDGARMRFYVNGTELVFHAGWSMFGAPFNTKVALGHLLGGSGTYEVKVAVIDGNNSSNVSYATETFTYVAVGSKLDDPSGAIYDPSTKKVSWSPVSGAAGYLVEVLTDGYNAAGPNCIHAKVSSPEFELYDDPNEHVITVKIMAYGDLAVCQNSGWYTETGIK